MDKKVEKRNDITITGSIGTYTISHQSISRGTLIGEFKFKTFLLPLEKLSAGRDKRAMLGEFESLATENERFMAYALSELKYRITSAPSFWINDQLNGNIPEEDLIFKVIDAALYIEALYAEQKTEEKQKLLDKALKLAEEIVVKNQEDKESKKSEDEDDLDLDDEE